MKIHVPVCARIEGNSKKKFSPGLRTTWQFSVKNDGDFIFNMVKTTAIKLQGVVQDLKELHKLVQYCLHYAILLLG